MKLSARAVGTVVTLTRDVTVENPVMLKLLPRGLLAVIQKVDGEKAEIVYHGRVFHADNWTAWVSQSDIEPTDPSMPYGGQEG